MTILNVPLAKGTGVNLFAPAQDTVSGRTRLSVTRSVEGRVTYVADRPITVEEYLDLWNEHDNIELIDGVGVEKEVVQLDHERLFNWLYRVIGDWGEEQNLGELLGSRSAVPINPFRVRLPDLLFVSRTRAEIVQQRSLTDAPDLIVELVSPSDRSSDLIALETDYRSIGVREIVFIDRPRQSVRVMRLEEAGTYTEENLAMGAALVLTTLNGLTSQTDWLFTEPRPIVRTVLSGQNLTQPSE